MANFIVSYDLNGPKPSHKEMDDHLRKVCGVRGRILETVWYLTFQGSAAQLRNYVQLILRKEDQLLVVRGSSAAWQNLLVTDAALKNAWEAQPA
jgi:hypothetical protein